jgi:5-methylcytosine-specific restriction endonuclease McrA
MNKFPHCDKECKNKNSLAQHRNRCPMNDDRTAVGFEKGNKTGLKGAAGDPTPLLKYSAERLTPLQDILDSEYPNYPTGKLKKRLVKEGILEYKCVLCGNDGNHNGLPLTLQLDHINGVNNDHRLNNLRLLCPNCHTQQDTYAGKNKNAGNNKPKKEKPPKKFFFEVKLKADIDKWQTIKNNSNIRFGEWGWKVRLGKEIGINGQKVNNWLKRVDPEFLEKVKNM